MLLLNLLTHGIVVGIVYNSSLQYHKSCTIGRNFGISLFKFTHEIEFDQRIYYKVTRLFA